MKYKTFFRLLLKALGVWLTVNGIIASIKYCILLVHEGGFGPGFPDNVDAWMMAELLQGLLQIGFGLYLLLGGRWIVHKVIPSNRPYCLECGYDLTLIESNRCPECGTEFKAVGLAPEGQGGH